jgi:indolepyruvate ferredoxin oxidoreductase
VKQLLTEVDHDNYDKVLEIAALPGKIKGFGHIKMSNIERYREQLARLRKKLKAPDLAVVVNG